MQGHKSIPSSIYFRRCDGIYQNLEMKQLDSTAMRGRRLRTEAETKTSVKPAEPAWNAGTEVDAEAYWPSESTKAKVKTRKEPVRVTKG